MVRRNALSPFGLSRRSTPLTTVRPSTTSTFSASRTSTVVCRALSAAIPPGSGEASTAVTSRNRRSLSSRARSSGLASWRRTVAAATFSWLAGRLGMTTVWITSACPFR